LLTTATTEATAKAGADVTTTEAAGATDDVVKKFFDFCLIFCLFL
jgi:hypothetical protein